RSDFMTAFLIIFVFAVFAALMLTRKMPAILAVPAMAIAVAVIVRAPLDQILNHVVANGATRLAEAYLTVFAGAMLGRVVMQTGVAEGIIKRAAEFGGDRPLVVAVTMMVAVAFLFTSLVGLGAIIMVGGLALPIMMSIGVPRKLAGILFLLAYGLGFVFNIGMWAFYQKALNLDPQAIKSFAAVLTAIQAVAVVIFLLIASKRMSSYGAWAVAVDEMEIEKNAKRAIPLIALLTPIVPLVLHLGFKWHVVPSFFVAAILGVLIARPRETVQQLSGAAVRGLEDVTPAVILMIGIGMLLNATTMPAVQDSLKPLVTAINFKSPVVYVAFFGLLSPLALYRGPLNPYGIGIGLYSLIGTLGLLPPLALLAALMSVVQVQAVCDPTNTHNVWIANYVGMRAEETTRGTVICQIAVCILGLALGSILYLN
ncbi:MAG: citrate transporter, partial [Blastocatellales bacterium]